MSNVDLKNGFIYLSVSDLEGKCFGYVGRDQRMRSTFNSNSSTVHEQLQTDVTALGKFRKLCPEAKFYDFKLFWLARKRGAFILWPNKLQLRPSFISS